MGRDWVRRLRRAARRKLQVHPESEWPSDDRQQSHARCHRVTLRRGASRRMQGTHRAGRKTGFEGFRELHAARAQTKARGKPHENRQSLQHGSLCVAVHELRAAMGGVRLGVRCGAQREHERKSRGEPALESGADARCARRGGMQRDVTDCCSLIGKRDRVCTWRGLGCTHGGDEERGC